MMRISSLDPIVSETVQEILGAVLLERSEAWYLSELARRLRRTTSTLQRPLEALVDAGIIRRSTDGNRVYFGADPDCPFLPELRGLLAKTVGLLDVVREALHRHGKRIRFAFVYGSVARHEQRSASDVDLLVVGSTTLAELSPDLAKAEKRLGRLINAVTYSELDFRDQIARENHFLQSVLSREKIFVKGTADELEELARPRKRRTTRHEQGRAR